MQEKDRCTIKKRCKLSILFLTILLFSIPILLIYDFLLVHQSKEKNLFNATTNFPRKNDITNSAKDNQIKKSFPSVAAEEVYTYGRSEGKKYAFLTFDDGPNPIVTPQILEILKTHDVKATFFVLGCNANSYPEILKRIFDEGHAIANHTYSHDYKKIYPNNKVNTEAFQDEVNETKKTIVKILGSPSSSRVVRFPGGSFENWKKSMKDKLICEGMYFIDWNTENHDGLKHNVSTEEQLNTISHNIDCAESRDENLVILMHDSVMKQSTVDALPTIIELIKAKGYTFAIIH
ncbi:MAG: polysaccharide deacetylase [Clostridiales bacterium]|uniref:polysaccharide deacetylase family protein n=1 Tax=Clostridium sp. N3C TaxID=1776758 RepID=UPI00092E1C33|nr:polysaccharide deacetylase family protein [Clostridium sp. N3C]NLZ48787.1 polysaccharide deacetylase [Clostridiales bacterium]SCN22038.1 putative polysaccharide deacetylase PdaA precursor [Clostridium sp. N3C]